jgi:hypothetical protein
MSRIFTRNFDGSMNYTAEKQVQKKERKDAEGTEKGERFKKKEKRNTGSCQKQAT